MARSEQEIEKQIKLLLVNQGALAQALIDTLAILEFAARDTISRPGEFPDRFGGAEQAARRVAARLEGNVF